MKAATIATYISQIREGDVVDYIGTHIVLKVIDKGRHKKLLLLSDEGIFSEDSFMNDGIMWRFE
jgi:hypothetical protein